MKDNRGKAVEVNYNKNINEFFQDYSCSSSSDIIPCKKHPQQSSSVGICAYCLKDRLLKLVCSDCGEQRLSSCSCSDLSSSNRNSSSVEVGSVGRVSFLIENEIKTSTVGAEEKPEVILLRRSNSSCAEIKKKTGLWRIGSLFRKSKRESSSNTNEGLWVVDYMGVVSRSRSLCSFRGGGEGRGGLLFGSASEDGGDVMSCYSGARSSISAARSSGVNGGFSETEPRKSGFDGDHQKRESSVVDSEFGSSAAAGGGNRRVLSLKESYFTGGEDSGFIDLKFDLSSDSSSAFGSSMRGCGGEFMASDHQRRDVKLSHGGTGSCRITVNEKGIRKSRKSTKGWRWIFKHHPNWITGRKIER